MAYPLMNSISMGNDLTYYFIYLNQVTNQLFMPMFLYVFFIAVLISSLVFQLRFNARIRPEVSLLASSFAGVGLSILFLQINGLIDPIHFFIMLGIFIASLIWVMLSSGE